jgi:VIT1/CCC1 family predicted Fe2+/Mn2+ transporter
MSQTFRQDAMACPACGVSLAFLGGLAARAGGAKIGAGVIRVVFWSALAMGVSSGVGALFGAVA